MEGLTWREEGGEVKPYVNGREVVWAPQPGSQEAFLSCPVQEVLLEGPRGTGKTDSLIMDFAQHVGKGFGPDWRGLLFRQSYAQLDDIVTKTKKWFPRVFPLAVYNESHMRWTFPRGETLKLSYMEREDDYWNWHGQQFTWIAFEELTTWPGDGCYKRMLTCLRSSHPRVPRKFRATTNPYGVGHGWVRARFELPVPPGRVCGPLLDRERRVAIHADYSENKVLIKADPEYQERVLAGARNSSELAAWKEGSWDIVAGGMIDDVWRPRVHVVPNIVPADIPSGWRIDRSYDHGQSRPFSVGWWAQSNGEPMESRGRLYGAVPKDLVRFAEWYGWSGQPNSGLRMTASEIADGILEREAAMGIAGRVRPGPADSSIFDEWEPGKSVAGDMKRRGVVWEPADKRAGSRKQGWQQLRILLKAAAASPREDPGLFVCEGCSHFLRTVPTLPRDERDLDDVDTDAEDHVGDEVRYRVRFQPSVTFSRPW